MPLKVTVTQVPAVDEYLLLREGYRYECIGWYFDERGVHFKYMHIREVPMGRTNRRAMEIRASFAPEEAPYVAEMLKNYIRAVAVFGLDSPHIGRMQMQALPGLEHPIALPLLSARQQPSLLQERFHG